MGHGNFNPPQNQGFLGGVSFFCLKSSIFESGRDKKFWWQLSAIVRPSATNRPNIGQNRRQIKVRNFKSFEKMKNF